MTQFNLFRHAKKTSYFPAGTMIFSQGESGDIMYVIVAGQVDIVIDGDCIATCGVGELVGEIAVLDRQPRSAAARARTGCTLAHIDQRDFHFLVDNTPYFAIQVMQLLAARLRALLPPDSTAPTTHIGSSDADLPMSVQIMRDLEAMVPRPTD